MAPLTGSQAGPDAVHLPSPEQATGIGPGSHLIIDRPDGTFGCTANYVWAQNNRRYLGAAGHCFLPEGKTSTHGSDADYDAALTTVQVCVSDCLHGGQTGFSRTGNLETLGPVVYARQTGTGGDVGNDFGLVRIPSDLVSQIRPTMPVWHGPTAASQTLGLGTIACFYGNSVAFGERWETMGRLGLGVTSDSDVFLMDAPSAFGDSGAAVNACERDADGVHGGGAVGVLTHLVVGSGFVAGTTVARAVEMADEANLSISIVLGS
ncbi:MAG: hypothetical protein HYT80_08925 [Euryarchaeota archaeon]|nr:hypothetical protein [Euryarchaeota archaeon]